MRAISIQGRSARQNKQAGTSKLTEACSSRIPVPVIMGCNVIRVQGLTLGPQGFSTAGVPGRRATLGTSGPQLWHGTTDSTVLHTSASGGTPSQRAAGTSKGAPWNQPERKARMSITPCRPRKRRLMRGMRSAPGASSPIRLHTLYLSPGTRHTAQAPSFIRRPTRGRASMLSSALPQQEDEKTGVNHIKHAMLVWTSARSHSALNHGRSGDCRAL